MDNSTNSRIIQKNKEEAIANCSICLEHLSYDINGLLLTITPCGHKFHSDCITNSVINYKNITCPLCRTPFLSTTFLKTKSQCGGPVHVVRPSDEFEWRNGYATQTHWSTCRMNARRLFYLLLIIILFSFLPVYLPLHYLHNRLRSRHQLVNNFGIVFFGILSLHYFIVLYSM